MFFKKTRTIELIQFDKIPAGQSATVAVMSYSGYDIEDALIINKASLDRGYGRCMVMRKYITNFKSYPNHSNDKHVLPKDDTARSGKNSHLLEEDGICAPGQRIRPNDIYINKMTPIDTSKQLSEAEKAMEGNYKSLPQTFKSAAPAYVDKVNKI